MIGETCSNAAGSVLSLLETSFHFTPRGGLLTLPLLDEEARDHTGGGTEGHTAGKWFESGFRSRPACWHF